MHIIGSIVIFLFLSFFWNIMSAASRIDAGFAHRKQKKQLYYTNHEGKYVPIPKFGDEDFYDPTKSEEWNANYQKRFKK